MNRIDSNGDVILPKKNVLNIIRTKSDFVESRFFKYRLDRNERTHPLDSEFMQHLKDGLVDEHIMVYPDPEPLYQSFSQWLGIDRNMLLFNSGSDLSIKSIFETYINDGDEILVHHPGYAMYTVYANMFGAKLRVLEYDSDLNFDIREYIGMIDENINMVVLENPNGFVGNVCSMQEIGNLIQRAKECKALVVIDEAYHPFHNESAVDYIDEFDNLIIVRTFSKAFGLAGLRAGYTIAQKSNIDYLYKVKPMHELNSMAIYVLTELLKNDHVLKKYLKETKESLDYLKKSLTSMGIEVSNSRANFVTAKIGTLVDCNNFIDEMRQYGFLIRMPFREKKLSDWLRIGTINMAIEREFIDKLQEVIRTQGG